MQGRVAIGPMQMQMRVGRIAGVSEQCEHISSTNSIVQPHLDASILKVRIRDVRQRMFCFGPGTEGQLKLKTEERGLGNSLGINALRHRKVGAIHLSSRSSINPGVFF